MMQITLTSGGQLIRVRDYDRTPMSFLLPHLLCPPVAIPECQVIVLKNWEELSKLRNRCGLYRTESVAGAISWLLAIETGATLFIPDYTLTLYHDVMGWVIFTMVRLQMPRSYIFHHLLAWCVQ